MAVSTEKVEFVNEMTNPKVSPGKLGLAFLEMLLLAVWLGSMIFFSVAVAPSAFSVLPSRHLAGQLVQSTLGKVEWMGLVIGALLLLLQISSWRARRQEGRGRWLRLGLLVLMGTATALSRFWVSPSLNSLRNSMGGMIDEVPVNDPLRVQFNDLHQYSVWLMGTAMLAGIVLLFFTVRSWVKR